jgi:hypothetical protein
MPIHQRSQRRNLPSRLTDHDRREASEAGRFSPSPPSAVSSSPSRIEEQRPEPLVTASSRPWRPYERRCRPSAFRRGRKESGRRLRFLSLERESALTIRAGQHQRRLWLLGGTEWDGMERTGLRQLGRQPTTCHFRRVRQHFLVWEKKGEWR